MNDSYVKQRNITLPLLHLRITHIDKENGVIYQPKKWVVSCVFVCNCIIRINNEDESQLNCSVVWNKYNFACSTIKQTTGEIKALELKYRNQMLRSVDALFLIWIRQSMKLHFFSSVPIKPIILIYINFANGFSKWNGVWR